MAGTVEGGKRAAKTNRERYGDGKDGRPDFYSVLGESGGKRSKGGDGSTRGFASKKIGKDGLSGNARAKIAGSKGGRISRRDVREGD